MLPNRFPDSGETPEFNAVDASLWYVVAVHEFLQALRPARRRAPRSRPLLGAVEQILAGYRDGTRYGIRMDQDGLLAAGVPGVQLTWMDAKIGDWVVTPRIGKPVEVQALWLNALRIGRRLAPEWGDLYRHALASFQLRFWNEQRQAASTTSSTSTTCRAATTPALRPNQILAVGGLPYQVLVEPYATRVVETVERELLTPLGLRSLAPFEPGYRRDLSAAASGSATSAYHQGTVWPWLMGPFVEAWLRVRGNSAGGEARGRRRASSRRCARISRSPASATSPRSPTPSRRTARAAARSRPGRWASCCASAGCSPSPARGRADRLRRLIRQGGSNHDAQGTAGGLPEPSGDRARPRPARRARPARRGRAGSAALEALGPLPQRAPVGHGARGLQRRRRRLGLLPARPRALAAPTAGARTASPASATTSQRLCLALALWNGKDPILKERLFGLTNGEGNHGEDVKELYYYLDATPTHSLPEVALQVPAGASSPTPGWSRRTAAAARTSPSSSCSTPASSTTTATSTSFVEYAKAGAGRHPDAGHGAQPRPRAGDRSTCCRSSGSATPGPGATNASAAAAAASTERRRDRRAAHASSATTASTADGAPDAAVHRQRDQRCSASAASTAPRPTSRTPSTSYLVHGARGRGQPATRAAPRPPRTTASTIPAGGSARASGCACASGAAPQPFADFDEHLRAAPAPRPTSSTPSCRPSSPTRTRAASSARPSPA